MYVVVKKNRRLFIERDGVAIWTPPDFLRHKIRSRCDVQKLADDLNAGADYISSVMALESMLLDK